MKILDVTFDYETLARGADAAPIQLAAAAWDRYSQEPHPFLEGEYNVGFDVRSCIFNGLKIDQDTVEWWSRQSGEAKDGVLRTRCHSLGDVITEFLFGWLPQKKREHKADAVCLWCQGMDFDVPMLKHQCKIVGYDMDKVVDYQCFCDARSFVLQGLETLYPDKVDMRNPREAYELLPPLVPPYWLPTPSSAHDALYDCARSTWNVWLVMKMMREGKK